MADRYTYIPLIGIFVIISFGLEEANIKSLHKNFIITGMSAIMAILSWQQLGFWQNSKTLFAHATQVTKDNYVAHNYLAKAFESEENLTQAEFHYRKSLELRPKYQEALVNFGVLLARQNKKPEAQTYLATALKEDPKNPIILNNLGNLAKVDGKYHTAINYYQQALLYNPNYQEALFNLANTLDLQSDYDNAIIHYKKAINLNPEFAEAHNGLGVTLAKSGKIKEAVAYFKKATKLKQNYEQAERNLATAQKMIK